MSHDFDNQEDPQVPDEKNEMLLRIGQLKSYCLHVAKLNDKRFILKNDGNTNIADYGDSNYILHGSLKFFKYIPDRSDILRAPLNWRELIDERFNLKKIRKQNRKEKNNAN